MKIILLIVIALSLAYADFTRSGEIVTDSVTSLEWQDNATPATMTWQESIDYCESLILGGDVDWRLPNLNELASIVDDSNYNPPINNTFVNTIHSNYWSSTTYTDRDSAAWYIIFIDGSYNAVRKTEKQWVRCVRAGEQ